MEPNQNTNNSCNNLHKLTSITTRTTFGCFDFDNLKWKTKSLRCSLTKRVSRLAIYLLYPVQNIHTIFMPNEMPSHREGFRVRTKWVKIFVSIVQVHTCLLYDRSSILQLDGDFLYLSAYEVTRASGDGHPDCYMNHIWS